VKHPAQLLFDGSEEASRPVATLDEFRRLNREEDGLLTLAQAAVVMGCSAARVGQLCDRGTLRSWHFWKSRYVSSVDVLKRAALGKSKGGRPRKVRDLAA